MKFSDISSGLGEADLWPPGFRFHPTDEELVLFYLKRKICRKKLKPDIIREIDVYKCDPEEFPGLSRLKSGDRQWFFFSPRDRKYPNGARSNRATKHGYWKATGKDRIITYNNRSVGVKKTLVFYEGRAPTGHRTDWVMHEYTLNEEEYKRCQVAHDYYALYKSFKKSGPGPKNGEQYGAHFKEEDWPDDGCSNVNDCALVDNSEKHVKDLDCVDNSGADCQFQSQDFEELMTRITDKPVNIQQDAVHCAYIPQLVGTEESQSAMVGSSSRGPTLAEKGMVPLSRSDQCNVQGSFDKQRQLPLDVAPEIASGPSVFGQQSPVVDGDFFKDFLEMDDLIGPEPTVQNIESAVQNTENPVEDLQFDKLDGLFELDLYHDADMFLRDVVPIDPVLVPDPSVNYPENDFINLAPNTCMVTGASQPHLNNFEDGMVNMNQHLLLNTFENEMMNPVSQLFPINLNNDMVNQLNFQFQPQFNDANVTGSQIWELDHGSSMFTPAEPNCGFITEPSSGAVYADNSSNVANQNQNGERENGRDSWISSALWGFVESIPSTPASAASNNGLVDKAMGRMSSFNRLRVSVLNTKSIVAGGNNPASTSSSSGNNKCCSGGFFGFSSLGVLCALFCMLIGTSIKVLERFISS